MKRFMKILKLLGIICLIVLASVGIGLTGAAPVVPKNRERHLDTTVKSEQVDLKRSHASATEITDNFKQ